MYKKIDNSYNNNNNSYNKKLFKKETTRRLNVIDSSFRFFGFFASLFKSCCCCNKSNGKLIRSSSKSSLYSSDSSINIMGSRLAKGDRVSNSDSSSLNLDDNRLALSESEIQLLLKNTTMSREQIVDFHRNFLKDCPNGYLNKKEFLKLFHQIHPIDKSKQKAEKFCDYVFK